MRNTILTLMSAVALTACSDGTGAGPQVSLSISGGLASAAAPAPGLSASRVAAGGNVLVLTTAHVVLREIELERAEIADCDAIDSCDKFEVGPLMMAIPVDGGVSEELAIDITPGTYDEMEFDIHKVGGDAADVAFLLDYPDMEDRSVRVTGTYNGVPFTYYGGIDEELELALSPVMVIDENTGSTNITLRLDLSTWFLDQSGNLIDPATANVGGQFEGVVKENIKNSLSAFEDRDKDGDETDEG